jgi:transmembrane sensor
LRREAAGWLARLQSGRDPNIERKFERWRDADPRHAAAFNRVRRSFDQAALLRHSPVFAPIEDETPIRKSKWQSRPALAAAMAAAIFVPIGLLAVGTGLLPLGGTDAVMLMTSVGEIRQVDLADGSNLTLDTSTKVDVEMGRSRRRAHLRYGRARFRITQANQPFVVETANGTITSLNGVIDVEQDAQQDLVQVLAGTADVRAFEEPKLPSVTLGQGESLRVSSNGTKQKGSLAPAADWTRGMLQFDRTPLAAAVALANRYSERRIILASNLGTLRITGAFRAGDTLGLAKALAAAFSLSLQQREDGTLVLARNASSPPLNKKGG